MATLLSHISECQATAITQSTDKKRKEESATRNEIQVRTWNLRWNIFDIWARAGLG